jgi:hypothetical protein
MKKRVWLRRLGVLAFSALVATTLAACSSMDSSPTSPPGPVAAGSGNAKPVYYTPATATLADRTGDAVTSDGAGAYPPYNGTVGCELLNDNLGCIMRGTSRNLNYDLSGRISGTGPTGTLVDASNFGVNGVGSMAIGSSVLATASFNTSVGQFNFNTPGDPQTSQVLVTRVDAHTWTVEASATDVCNLPQSVPDPNNPHKTITVKSYYHLPFRYTFVTQ